MRLRGLKSVVVLLALGVLAATAGPASAATARRDVVFVANSYDGTVYLFDAHRFNRLGRPLNVVPDGKTPRDPAKARLYPGVIANRRRGQLRAGHRGLARAARWCTCRAGTSAT